MSVIRNQHKITDLLIPMKTYFYQQQNFTLFKGFRLFLKTQIFITKRYLKIKKSVFSTLTHPTAQAVKSCSDILKQKAASKLEYTSLEPKPLIRGGGQLLDAASHSDAAMNPVTTSLPNLDKGTGQDPRSAEPLPFGGSGWLRLRAAQASQHYRLSPRSIEHWPPCRCLPRSLSCPSEPSCCCSSPVSSSSSSSSSPYSD